MKGSSAAGQASVGSQAQWTEVRWRLRAPSAREGQVVCVVGSSAALGAWNHDAALELTRDAEDATVWSGQARLERGVECHYKYFIREGHALVKWESWRENRRLVPKGHQLYVDDGRFGVEKSAAGENGAASSSLPANVWEDYGWLVSDIQLRITLGAKNLQSHTKPRVPPVTFHDQSVRVQRLDFSSKDPNIQTKSVALDDPARDELKEHTFHTDGLSNLHLYVDFFAAESTTKLGRATITPSFLKDLIGMNALPIISSDLEEIGTFTFEYLIVKPFQHVNLQDVLARTYWKSTKFVDVGHRGCGANHAISKNGKKTIISENTLLSFVKAGQLGREAIEFDVQLTKDGVPVIYHDFSVPIEETGVKVPVYSLTLKKFKALAKCNRSWKQTSDSPPSQKKEQDKAKEANDKPHDDNLFPSTEEKQKLLKKRHSVSHVKLRDSSKQHTPLPDSFATLKEVFKVVPLSTGFNIEIKYPTIEQVRKAKVPLYPERNQIVDAVLKVVFDHAKDERSVIFFSSFDADICTMLSLKQPRYPVFFLTQGGTKHCLDVRRNSVPQAIRFAKSINLLGLVVDAHPLLENPDLIQAVKSSGLLLATYGDPNNEPENVRLQEEKGVDAVISDHFIIPRTLDA